jgi:hypothetical protein
MVGVGGVSDPLSDLGGNDLITRSSDGTAPEEDPEGPPPPAQLRQKKIQIRKAKVGNTCLTNRIFKSS